MGSEAEEPRSTWAYCEDANQQRPLLKKQSQAEIRLRSGYQMSGRRQASMALVRSMRFNCSFSAQILNREEQEINKGLVVHWHTLSIRSNTGGLCGRTLRNNLGL